MLKISNQIHNEARKYRRDETTAGLSTVFDIGVQERIEYLVQLNQKIQNIRGLERHVSRTHRDNLFVIQKGSIQAVLNAQNEVRRAGLDGTEFMCHQLAHKSEEISHGAKVYARLLAMADRRVAKELEQEQEEQKPTRRSSSLGHNRASVSQFIKWGSQSAKPSLKSWTTFSSSSKQEVACAMSSVENGNNQATDNPAA